MHVDSLQPPWRRPWEWGQGALAFSVDDCIHHMSFIWALSLLKQHQKQRQHSREQVSQPYVVLWRWVSGSNVQLHWESQTKPPSIHVLYNSSTSFLYEGTHLTIWRDKTTQRAWRQRGVRELQQRGRALLSRLKVERGCQPARNAPL